MAVTYTSLVYITGISGTRTLALHNPAMSGKTLKLLDITAVSHADTCEFELERWNGIPTFSGGATNPSIYKSDSASAAQVGVVTLDASLDVSALTMNWARDVQTLLADAGDDTSLLFYVPDSCKPILNAGESITVTMPTGVADYELNLYWEEA